MHINPMSRRLSARRRRLAIMAASALTSLRTTYVAEREMLETPAVAHQPSRLHPVIPHMATRCYVDSTVHAPKISTTGSISPPCTYPPGGPASSPRNLAGGRHHTHETSLTGISTARAPADAGEVISFSCICVPAFVIKVISAVVVARSGMLAVLEDEPHLLQL